MRFFLREQPGTGKIRFKDDNNKEKSNFKNYYKISIKQMTSIMTHTHKRKDTNYLKL